MPNKRVKANWTRKDLTVQKRSPHFASNFRSCIEYRKFNFRASAFREANWLLWEHMGKFSCTDFHIMLDCLRHVFFWGGRELCFEGTPFQTEKSICLQAVQNRCRSSDSCLSKVEPRMQKGTEETYVASQIPFGHGLLRSG